MQSFRKFFPVLTQGPKGANMNKTIVIEGLKEMVDDLELDIQSCKESIDNPEEYYNQCGERLDQDAMYNYMRGLIDSCNHLKAKIKFLEMD